MSSSYSGLLPQKPNEGGHPTDLYDHRTSHFLKMPYLFFHTKMNPRGASIHRTNDLFPLKPPLEQDHILFCELILEWATAAATETQRRRSPYRFYTTTAPHTVPFTTKLLSSLPHHYQTQEFLLAEEWYSLTSNFVNMQLLHLYWSDIDVQGLNPI